jgi:CDGSH-type Zn-finger protein
MLKETSVTDESKAGGMPIAITLDPGTYYRCTCGHSQNLPFCDESHKGGKHFPVQFQLTERKKVYLCSCGQTADSPYCDGKCGVDLSNR